MIIVCYSVADRDSLKNVSDFWIPEARNQTKRKKPVVLIGCQTDSRDSDNADHVTTTQGTEVAEQIGAAAFFECSSATMSGISEVFQTIVKVVLKNRKKKLNIFNRILRR